MTNSENPTLARMKVNVESKVPFISVECFCPPNMNKFKELWDSLTVIEKYRPVFCSVTCQGPRQGKFITQTDLASRLMYCFGLDCVLHITGLYHSKQEISALLKFCLGNKISGILALRGDTLPNYPKGEFPHASDLVQYITTQKSQLMIGVAGYPAGHPESKSLEEDLHYLKRKIDVGADFIISQFFFQAEDFETFLLNCRSIHISTLILPGFLLYSNYNQLTGIMDRAEMSLPENIKLILEPIRHDDEAVKNFCIDHSVQMIKTLLHRNVTVGVHFFCLNRSDMLVKIAEQCGLHGQVTQITGRQLSTEFVSQANIYNRMFVCPGETVSLTDNLECYLSQLGKGKDLVSRLGDAIHHIKYEYEISLLSTRLTKLDIFIINYQKSVVENLQEGSTLYQNSFCELIMPLRKVKYLKNIILEYKNIYYCIYSLAENKIIDTVSKDITVSWLQCPGRVTQPLLCFDPLHYQRHTLSRMQEYTDNSIKEICFVMLVEKTTSSIPSVLNMLEVYIDKNTDST